jgi:AraC family transcriptional regulator
MQVTRRTLFDGAVQIAHVVARPPASKRQELECRDCNVLILPLAGIFAKHDSPRQQVIATPNHGVFIEAGKSYRISYPAGIGDECLSIRYPAAALAAAPRSHTLLPPGVMLARSVLWRRFAAGAWDPLEVEEVALGVLAAVLDAARSQGRKGPVRRRQAAERVKEAISLHPERKWRLSELAEIACLSHWHLARVFRAQVGESIHAYVLRARLAKALDAVLDTDSDLSAIALELGFSSHSHFTARFRALFGLAPTELRQTASGTTAAELRKILTAGKRACD